MKSDLEPLRGVSIVAPLGLSIIEVNEQGLARWVSLPDDLKARGELSLADASTRWLVPALAALRQMWQRP